MTLVQMNDAAVHARKERRERLKSITKAVVENSKYAKSLDTMYSITKMKPSSAAENRSED